MPERDLFIVLPCPSSTQVAAFYGQIQSMKPESAIVPAPVGVFRALQEQLAGVVGQDFFRQLVRHLAVALDVEYAFVTTRKPQDPNRLLLVAGWHVNRAAAGGNELLLADTPAARTLMEGQLWCEDETASAYPKDRWLRKHGIQAYCAVAIPGLDGRALGHLGIMSRQAFQASDELFSALQTFALRAAAELRRRHLDDIQRQTAIKFAASFRISHAILGVLDLENEQCTDINPAVERLLGFSPAELIGRNMRELGLWENPQACEDVLQEIKAGGRIGNYGIGLRNYTGEVRHGHLSAEVMEYDQRRYALFSILDDTDYRAAVDGLNTRAALSHALYNAEPNPILIFEIDKDGQPSANFLETNDATYQVLGYSSEELLKLAPLDLMQVEAWNDIAKVLMTRHSTEFEANLSCKSGSSLHFRIHAWLVVSANSQAVMLQCRDPNQPKQDHGNTESLESSYRSMFEHALEGIYQSTTDGHLTGANPALARILGYDTPEEMIANGLNIASRVYVRPEQRAELLRRIEQYGHYANQEFQVFRRDGTTIWVCDNARAIKDKNGNVLHYAGTLQDITSRKRAEQALVRSEEKYRTLVDMSQDGVFLSQAGKFSYVNRAFAYMLGYEPEEITGLPITDIVLASNGKLAEQIVSDTVSHRAIEPHEMHLRCKDVNNQVTASVTVSRISWRGRSASMGTVRDITEHKKVEQELVHNAYHDALTGLPNRNFFMDRLSQALDHGGKRDNDRFAVLFLDLDRFKLINDSLGHSFGDRLLVAIAKRLRTCLRPNDLIARHGGDEFTILLERLQSLDEATTVADRIHEELARAFSVNGHDVFTTASIGIVISASHYQHPDELLRDADTAMYRAKAAGKSGYVVFDDEMHERVKAHLKLETELRHALQRNEFRVYYQPVMELATGRLTGFEALVRWAHPELGLVAPEDFLAVAEETGLIIPLGWWVMETACTQLASWRKRYKHLSENIFVSVNIANRQFAHWVLPQRVARVLDMTGLSAKNLCLEITETVFMDNPELAVETISRLRTIGVNLQMDDFGTGYSSLSALRTFKLDTLKIDRSFISGIEQNRSDRAIVRTINVLAADLGMDVVAEGIENSRQLELLRALGCRRGQGYYFSKPFAEKEVERYLAALTPPKG
jgi:diguanylate cyclase (GGDEF)-like protein/PAS domain S-box-containing protein